MENGLSSGSHMNGPSCRTAFSPYTTLVQSLSQQHLSAAIASAQPNTAGSGEIAMPLPPCAGCRESGRVMPSQHAISGVQSSGMHSNPEY